MVSGGYSSLQCAGFSLWWPLLLRSTGSSRMGFNSCGTQASVVVAHGLSCSMACGIFPDQGSNPCLLHWQADSQPLHHQGSPTMTFNVINDFMDSCNLSYLQLYFKINFLSLILHYVKIREKNDNIQRCDPDWS